MIAYLDITAEARSTAIFTSTSSVVPEFVSLDCQRVRDLEDLDRSVHRVTHMYMDTVQPVSDRSRSEAATLCFRTHTTGRSWDLDHRT